MNLTTGQALSICGHMNPTLAIILQLINGIGQLQRIQSFVIRQFLFQMFDTNIH
jgi:hypothetical protein